MRLRLAHIGGSVLLASALLLAREEGDFVPARMASGHLPGQPPLASEGGFVVLEAEITATGLVSEVTAVRDAPPFTSELGQAVRSWRFLPARKEDRPVASRAIVMGVFRPPVLLGAEAVSETLSEQVSEGIPFPTSVVTPSFPPRALEDGLVLVEIEVDEEGIVSGTSLVRSSPAFDELALDAAEAFRFRPAHVDGKPVRSFALVVFGFRQPVTHSRPRH